MKVSVKMQIETSQKPHAPLQAVVATRRWPCQEHTMDLQVPSMAGGAENKPNTRARFGGGYRSSVRFFLSTTCMAVPDGRCCSPGPHSLLMPPRLARSL